MKSFSKLFTLLSVFGVTLSHAEIISFDRMDGYSTTGGFNRAGDLAGQSGWKGGTRDEDGALFLVTDGVGVRGSQAIVARGDVAAGADDFNYYSFYPNASFLGADFYPNRSKQFFMFRFKFLSTDNSKSEICRFMVGSTNKSNSSNERSVYLTFQSNGQIFFINEGGSRFTAVRDGSNSIWRFDSSDDFITLKGEIDWADETYTLFVNDVPQYNGGQPISFDGLDVVKTPELHFASVSNRSTFVPYVIDDVMTLLGDAPGYKTDIPEPASFTLMLSGIASLLVVFRRGRKCLRA